MQTSKKESADIEPIKKTTTTITEETIPAKPETALQETDDTRNPAAFQSAISAWLKTVNCGGFQYTATLYKYDPVHKQKQSVVCESVDEVMTLDDIGLAYGSGAYRYLVSFPDRQDVPPKAAIFNIHEIYDERRKKLGLVKPDKPDVDPSNGKGNMVEMLELMKSFAEIMRSIMPAPVPTNPDIAAMIKGNYEFMQGILKKSYEDTSDMYKTMMQANADTFGDGQEEKQEAGIFEKIMPLLDKFLPVLLGAGPKTDFTIEMIKKLPEFQSLLADKAKMKAVIDGFKREVGPVKAATIMKRLGVGVKE